MIIGLTFVIGGCALGVIGLSIIAAGDRIPPTPSTTAAKDVGNQSPSTSSGRSNAQLRNYVIQYAARMRTFENNSKNQDSETILRTFPIIQGESEDQKKQRWQLHSNNITRRLSEKQLAFENNLLPEARLLNDELRERLSSVGILPPVGPEVFTRTRVLMGSLAGVRPIGEFADYLETMARKLPD